jgi:hypothetical protein
MTAVYTFVKSEVARVTNKLNKAMLIKGVLHDERRRADLLDSLLGLWTPDAYFNSLALTLSPFLFDL